MNELNEQNKPSSEPKTTVADGFAIHATAKQLLDLIRIPENFGDQILDAKSATLLKKGEIGFGI